ncbi:MaoC family dehydratase [Streptomyces sp. NBC_00006]|uniref:MaoC family dehydratase n=1 Tax=unclassified Streptomyces TaxID=2593676 RepID=UPI00224D817C|nr:MULTISPECIES: MaoC family dehydratase [unclassified Streptomyces]MCX4835153.1 MaoC family dehydratase [Streptomyces sp. NBC_01016]MCX5537636.1 MaoC family dehydratase [Streptomyces sp. NBC_00006]
MTTPSTHAIGPDFNTPIEKRYFEDYVPGSTYTYGSITVTEQAILRFAGEFDTQDIHTDPEAAATGPFGGLIASGWHTASVMMRLYADHYVSKVASLASPGIDELRWPRPVRPGDSLSIRTTVRSARPSRSKPDRGLVHTDVEVLDQHGETVLTLTAMNLLLRRDQQ